jgi:hypothetical protein
LFKVSHVKIDRIVDRFAVRTQPFGDVDRPKPVERRERNLGAVRGYLGVEVVGSGLRVFFGLIPMLLSLTVLKANDPPVVIAIGLCGISYFE